MAKSRIAGITIEIGGDTTGLQDSLKNTNKNISDTQSSLKDVNRLLKLDPTNTELLRQKQQLLKQAIGETNEKLQALKQAETQAQQQFKEGKISEEQYNALKREIAATETSLRDLEEQAASCNSKLTKIADVAGKIGEKATQAGKKMSKITAVVAGIGAAAVKTTADFESSMSNVKAISGATAEDMQRLEDKAREMGEQTKFSATEAGDAMSYMAMAGWKTGAMLEGIEGIMNLAAASGEDLAATSDIVTDALTAFGTKAEDITKTKVNEFVDVLAATASNSNTNVAMLGESFQYCAPVCGALGYSAADTSVALGLMANSGIKATNSGTALRTLLTNLAKPTKQSYAAMEELGISLTDSEGNMKSLREVIDDLRKGFGQSQISADELTASITQMESAYENGEMTAEEYETAQQELMESAYGVEGAEKAKLAAMLAGKYGMSGLLAIVNASEEDYNKLSSAIDNSSGAAKNMADTMNDNLSGQITILKSQLQELAISFGKILIPKIKDIVGYVQKLVDKFNGLSDSQRKLVIKIGLVVAAIGPMLIALGKMSTGISAVVKMIKGIGTAVSALSGLMAANPVFGGIAITIAGIAALTAGLVALNKVINSNSEAVKQMTEEEEQHISAINDSKKAYDETMAARNESVKAINSEYTNLQALSEELDNIIDENGRVKEGYEDRANVITGLLSNALGVEIGITDGVIENYKELKTSIDDTIRSKQAEALLNANEEAYTEALQKRAEAFTNMSNIQKDLENTEAELAKQKVKYSQAMYDYNKAMEEGTGNALDYKEAIANAEDEINRLNENLDTQSKALNDAQEVYGGYAGTIANYNGLIGAATSGNAEEIEEAINKITNSFITAENGTKESLENQVANMESTFNALQKSIDNNTPGITQDMVDSAEDMVNLAKAELDKLTPQAEEATTRAGNAAAAGIMNTSPMVTNASFKMINESKTVMEAVDFATTGKGTAQAVAEGITSGKEDITNATEESFSGANAYITSLPKKGNEWGADFGDGLIGGIRSKAGGIASAASDLASTIRSFLHFSVPDKGPLTDYETWMPDFIGRMAEQIKQNQHLIADAASGVAASMDISGIINTELKGTQAGNTQINFNGNYKFDNRTDIDYFMNQAALKLKVTR